jgi:hypothetical protein
MPRAEPGATTPPEEEDEEQGRKRRRLQFEGRRRIRKKTVEN